MQPYRKRLKSVTTRVRFSNCGKVALAIWLTVMLGGCQTYSPNAFKFDSYITQDGYKLFQLTLPPTDTELKLPSEQHGNPSNHELSERQLMDIAEQTLAENHYCREGFTLLGRYGGETTDRVRGECREKATEEDRRKFPNTIDRW